VTISDWPTRASPAAQTSIAELAVEACREHACDLGCEAALDRIEEIVEAPADELQRELAGPDGEDLEAVVAGLADRFSSPG
jgi:hypothetical protein